MSQRKYTDEDINNWFEMYNDGKTQEEIALDVGVSLPTVSLRLREHPDYVPRSKGPALGSKRNDSREPAKPGSKAVKKVVYGNAHFGHKRSSRHW